MRKNADYSYFDTLRVVLIRWYLKNTHQLTRRLINDFSCPSHHWKSLITLYLNRSPKVKRNSQASHNSSRHAFRCTSVKKCKLVVRTAKNWKRGCLKSFLQLWTAMYVVCTMTERSQFGHPSTAALWMTKNLQNNVVRYCWLVEMFNELI